MIATNPSSTTATTTTTAAASEAERRCPACHHRKDTHDAIGVRFCAATVALGTDRGCVCVSGATTG